MKKNKVSSKKWIVYSIILTLLITNIITAVLLITKKDAKETVVKETVVKEAVKANKSKTEKKPVNPRKLNLSKFVSGDTHEVDYSDLNYDGNEEIIITFCTYNKYKLAENSYIRIIGWDGREYKQLCKTFRVENCLIPSSIEVKDINDDKKPEIITEWSSGKQSYLYISRYLNGAITTLGAFRGSNGVTLTESFADDTYEVEAGSRDYDDAAEGDTETVEVYKWSGNKYVLSETYRIGPVLRSRKVIPNTDTSAVVK